MDYKQENLISVKKFIGKASWKEQKKTKKNIIHVISRIKKVTN